MRDMHNTLTFLALFLNVFSSSAQRATTDSYDDTSWLLLVDRRWKINWEFFLGELNHIKNIKANYKIPILCKDFFIDTYQVALAKSFGADCILIILSAIDKKLAEDMYQAANDLNISTLIEVHSENEAEIALSFEDSLIGINNRNLKTLEISLNTSVKLSRILNSHKNPLVCESGINSAENIKFIVENTEIYNFLIGESLLKNEDIGSKLKEFSQIRL